MNATQINIHKGIRGKTFSNFISNILRMGSLQEKHITQLVSDNNLKMYEQAFTHKTASLYNYECFEFLGDASVNKAISWYLTRKRPIKS